MVWVLAVALDDPHIYEFVGIAVLSTRYIHHAK